MRAILLGLAAPLAAFAIPAAPALAQSMGQGFTAQSVELGASSAFSDFQSGHRDGRREGRRHRRFPDTVVIGDWGRSDAWAQYNNRGFESDSYNDWWHDRPDCAFPRWMQNNQNCERLWWSGGGWRC